MKIGKYWKTVIAAVAAGAVVANEFVSDDVLSSTEGVNIALAILGAVGVWAVPNKDTEGDDAVDPAKYQA